MSVVVTGGAGFIGSCIVRSLNDMGIDDIYIVDNISTTEKWMNLRNKKYITYFHKSNFLEKLRGIDGITHIFHLGACSSTIETDFDYLWENNVEYSKSIWRYCTEKQISMIYASSAATYGSGEQGFDDKMDITLLKPLNGYGYSKQAFDMWAQEQTDVPMQYAGLKFFNVYGPNEYFKGSMASMIYHGYKQIKLKGEIRLFKSDRAEYEDGGQLRDFVYVKDICEVVKFLMEHKDISGLFNVGTGRAQTFRELAESVFKALGLEPNILFIDMPENLKDKYQYYTQASMEKLRERGYNGQFCDLEKGACDYVINYLDRGFEIY